MNDHVNNPDQLAPEESHADSAFDAAGALDVAGPTARQELFLRRQKLWSENLTQQQASEMIADFLARKHAERRLGCQCRDQAE